jgi:hypothetical protein
MSEGAEIHQQLASKYQHNKACISGSECLKEAELVLLIHTGKDTHPNPETNKIRRMLKQ